MGYLIGKSFTRATQSPWAFHITYENQSGKIKKDTCLVDFSQVSHLIIGCTVPVHDIAKHLEALQNDAHHLTAEFDKINVITQTKQEEQGGMKEFVNRQRGLPEAESDDRGENQETP